jgi:hypothetical protein
LTPANNTRDSSGNPALSPLRISGAGVVTGSMGGVIATPPDTPITGGHAVVTGDG